MKKKFEHTPVLLHESVNSLNIKKNGIYIDATFGSGGHSKLILSQLGVNGKLLAIDCDPEAVASAKIKDPRFSIVYGRFSSLVDYVTERKLLDKIDGVLLDLGVSARQLEDPERGFSFMNDGLLDMRMDPTQGYSAAEWLLTAKEKDIIFVLKNYGEERFAKRIARAITVYNRKHSIMRTKELANIIVNAMPLKEKYKHPATRSFQAIRIWINNELKEIDKVLKGSLSVLALGGRLSIISFHSLEDRLVKRFIRNQDRGPQLPNGIPITESQLRVLGSRKLKTIGKIFPSIVEVNKNPRARSAILRVAERII